VLPFLVFLGLTFGQGKLGVTSMYWLYAVKTVVGAVMIWIVWPWVSELRWKVSTEAVLTGVAVFVVWVGLDGLYPDLNALMRDYACPVLEQIGLQSLCPSGDPAPPWNPHQAFGQGTLLAWFFIVVRLLGSTLVVPPLEEVFYRSYVYRYIVDLHFEKVPLGAFHWRAFILTSTLFGLAHREWLAGILCGLAYQGLVCRKKRLGDAMVAHAVTNFLLGVWVMVRGAWQFW
jgi:membrane protease YdiL (CAAX protease family)